MNAAARVVRAARSASEEARYARSCVRVDAPLPGDLVIRRQADESRLTKGEVFVITCWPDPETIEAGPYQSYGYALRQAQRLLKDRSERIWYDHARIGQPEELEEVGGPEH
jgi:hypothetical protein